MTKKDKIFVVVIVVFAMAITGVVSVSATNYIYSSSEISYNNDPAKLKASNVQDAIDELYAHSRDFNELREMIYPVGSIYISVTDSTVEQVEERFGGTWEAFGTGKTLVGIDTSDSNFDTVEESNGSKTVTLSVDNLPAHSHSYTPSGTVSSSFSGNQGTTSTTGAHTHNVTSSVNLVTNQRGTIYVTGGTDRLQEGGATLTAQSAGNHSHTFTPSGSVTSTFKGSGTYSVVRIAISTSELNFTGFWEPC